MAFPFFFKRHFGRLAKMSIKKLAAATTELTKATEKAVEKTGATPATLLRETKERMRRRIMLPPFLRSMGSALRRVKESGKEVRKATATATARASVPTLLQSAIAAHARAFGVPYDAKLAEKVAGEAAARPEIAFVIQETGSRMDRDDYAVQAYLKEANRLRIAAGLPTLEKVVPSWAKFDIAARIKVRAIPVSFTRGAEYADRAFEEAFLEVPMPGFLDGGTIDDVLEGVGGPF